MKKTFLILFTLGLVLSFSLSCIAQTIWPGDVNNNGIVNGVDVLYVGLADGAEGSERVGGNASWTGQTITSLWSQSFADGTNYAYADCDGDGEVEDEDITNAIKINFNKTHGVVTPDVYSTDGGGNAPFVELLPQVANVGLSEMIHFDLWLGNASLPVQNFYGIALEMSYNPDFAISSPWSYTGITSPWFDPVNHDSETLFFVDPVAGKMHLAITRTNQQSINGAGKIGSFTIVIEDIVVGLQMDTLRLQIDKIKMIDQNSGLLSVVPDSSFVVVSRPNRTIDQSVSSSVRIYPNPTQTDFTIESMKGMLGYDLFDIRGKLIKNIEFGGKTKNTTKVDLSREHLSPQLCLLKIYTTKGTVTKKVVIQ